MVSVSYTHLKAEAFQIVAQFFIIHVCPFRADLPEKGAKKEGRLSSTRKTALLQFQYSLGWFERFAARNQFKELLLLRRIAARRAPSGKERSADDVIAVSYTHLQKASSPMLLRTVSP